MKTLFAPKARKVLRAFRDWRALPAEARREARRDHREGAGRDPGADIAVRVAVEWLCRAQDRSGTSDGGVPHSFSLIDGWTPSYPETTGYIVPTLIEVADESGDKALLQRVRRMLDWLVSIQRSDGSFQGGLIDADPVVPVTFNTGQILLGLAAGAARLGDAYREPVRAAADWLIDVMDEDGAWRSYPTPFAIPGEKAYEAHAAWGMMEAARVEPGRGYGEAALRHIRWVLSKQSGNGWFHSCCLTDPGRPLMHTLGYAFRGVVEAYRFDGDPSLLEAALKTAEGLLLAMDSEGRLPGRVDADWRPAVPWTCLTGNLQVALCWFILHEETGDERFLEAARAANRFVRRTVATEGPTDQKGGVKGSFPVDGDYGRYQYLSWAAKFFIDANRMERSFHLGP